ncbi:MAG: bifunctional (p)ppGpp synthetase/guanosine-3',5'-bis(diphosphate) 3'-pyrophosphohydrolase [Muribaculaceae bacterium]|nr:bifunctional (p)ppGpp synthetase/guanosine-3',5'-bis(diphosphate) 3'-pyrophosphohydrolase [Muribaculaceae bacterium]MBQ4138265.1 bifunctional (p)ppGpp synthetase/guanosine-3',5'-bis(diphosphate) 3'-pyrophosphohydrolase [Muribaculaceae bacterium]
MNHPYFTREELAQVQSMIKRLIRMLDSQLTVADVNQVDHILRGAVSNGHYVRDKYGLNPVVRFLRTALTLTENIAPDRSMVIATLLFNLARSGYVTVENVRKLFGEDIAKLVKGLVNVSELYRKQAAVEDDNFHKLLLSFAADIRVVIIMIVDRLALMREINLHEDEKFVREISTESRYLYAPLAHKLGLYGIKSELEDLSLKYLNRKVYNQIARKLNETKVNRDKYIADFVKPIKNALDKSGLKYEMKGRTKSINSIWNKMVKQGVDLNGVYDLFAIRIILDTPVDEEKKACWIAYSIVTDIYMANVSRLRDWITIPKSNGYESLHITVRGPEDKWVEVQIRTQRMDEVAERGLAAHWRYKGVKSEGEIDQWMNNVREVLEAGVDGQMELIRNMNMNLYEKEVFVFTPKGDLFKLRQGATVLDFAFHIHTKIGCRCTGAKIDGKTQKINYVLKSGDTVEIMTSSTQVPRQDWLNYVVTSKARNKIKQAINEANLKKAEIGREMLTRRMKNRKVDSDDAMLAKFIKKQGFKNINDFYVELHDRNLDVVATIDQYVEFMKRQTETVSSHETAENFVLVSKKSDEQESDDILVIGENVKGINYKLSKCCNPIYGDRIMGFIASDGAIKIHRSDCGNLKHLKEKYPYRIIKSEWSGRMGKQFVATLRVVGQDDIGIVANMTSLINKEGNAMLRNITINSLDGLFEGYLVISVDSLDHLDELMKKMRSLKGVKEVERT